MGSDSRTPFRLDLTLWVKLWALAVVIWLTAHSWGLLADVAMIVFGAFLLSLAIRPMASALERWVPRGLTVLLAYVLLIGLLVLLGFLLVPVVRSEVNDLIANGPTLIEDSLQQLNRSRLIGPILPSVDTLSHDLSQQLDQVARTALGTVTTIGALLLEIFIVLILSYFFVTDETMGDRLISGWIPLAHRPRTLRIAQDIQFRLSRWVWAQLGIAVYFAVVFSAGLYLLGIPFALTIGLVGGVLEIVPYLGGLSAWLLASFSAISMDPIHVLWVTLYYIAVVQIEAHIIAPNLYGRVTGIHPALVLIVLITGAKVNGILGVLFAVPALIIAIVLIEEFQGQLVPHPESPDVPGRGARGQPAPSEVKETGK